MKFLRLLLMGLASTLLQITQAQAKPFLINCGSNSSTDVDDRNWVGDLTFGNNFTLSFPGIIASTATVNEESSYQSLYRTARIFNMTSDYNFSVFSGSYCIRLHFYPFSFENFNVNESVFDVTANELKLVSKFNVPGEISWKNMNSNSVAASLVKEYFLNVSSNELHIEFVPNSGSFAFVNAIEVIPVGDNLFVVDLVNEVGGSGSKTSLSMNDRGIETMYRLNVGGPGLNSREDRGLWRKWESDEKFVFSLNAATVIRNASNISYVSSNDSLIAPLMVYETARMMTNNEVVEKRFNVSWRFDVDPNFDYLVRLHFCELVYDGANERVFRIYINNKTAAGNFDVFLRAQGMNKAYHEDYADLVPQQVDTLWLQLGPDLSTTASGTDALLNGVEIFKLSRNGNLAHASERITGEEGLADKKPERKGLWEAIGVGSVSVVTISIVCTLFFFCIQKKKATSVKENPPGWHPLFLHETIGSTTDAQASKLPVTNNVSSTSNRIGRRFMLSEIRAATRNFDESLVIGAGGFGKVYKGEIEEGNMVAIKRAHPQSEQGLAEFETEIEMLSKLRHRHLVSMIGYCEEQQEMILVFEYMANGTLRSHLYGSAVPALTWKQRVEACIGAARGLHYLHTGAERGIIHRDVKTTNILLDENLVAKMADFGLSKDGPAFDHTHVSTAVKGSFGYLDPEYFRRQQLTQKSDVYSFGVVLFEVVCARPVINPSLPKDQINLAEWALRWQRQRSLETIVDPQLEADYSLESLKKFGEIAEKCLADEGKNRPTMGEVLWHLEYVLQLNEAYKRSGDQESFGSSVLGFADSSFGSSALGFANSSFGLPHIIEQVDDACSKPLNIKENAIEPIEEEHCLEDTIRVVDFSQLVNPQGR